MARVTSNTVSEQFAFLVERLMDYWGRIPDAFSEFEKWDVVDQIVFEMEWAIPRGFLDDLNELRDAGLLNEEQQRRYQDLCSLMTKKQPVLDEILKPDPPRTEL